MKYCVMCSVAQSRTALCNPMDFSSPHSSVHGDSPGTDNGVGCRFLFQGLFPTLGWNPHLLCLLYWQADSLSLRHLGSPVLGWDPKTGMEGRQC